LIWQPKGGGLKDVIFLIQLDGIFRFQPLILEGKKPQVTIPPCVHEGFSITILTLKASASPALVEQVKRRCGEEQLRQAIALPWPKVQNGIPKSWEKSWW